jgi:hypothetical protein
MPTIKQQEPLYAGDELMFSGRVNSSRFTWTSSDMEIVLDISVSK